VVYGLETLKHNIKKQHNMMKLKQNTDLFKRKKEYLTPRIGTFLVETGKDDYISYFVSVKLATCNNQKNSKQNPISKRIL